MVHRQHAAVRRHTFHMTHRSQAAFSPEGRWMIPIIFLRPPITLQHAISGCFARYWNAAWVLIFSLAPLTTTSLSFSPSFLLVLLLLQIDMSHCCRLTLSLESIIVSYFSFLRAVFSLLLSESLEALWGSAMYGERRRHRGRGREGGRGRDCNSWLWMHTSHFNVSTAAAVNAEKMRVVVVMKRRDGWGGEGCTYKPPTRSSSSVNKCVSGKRGQMPRCNIYMLCWWHESLRWRRMQSFPASCRLWPNFSISTHHPSSMLWSLSPRGSGGRKRCCQHSGEGRASQGPRILLKSPWARQYTLLFPP